MVEYEVSETLLVYSNIDKVHPFDLPSAFRFRLPVQQECGLEHMELYLRTYGCELCGWLVAEVQHGTTRSTFQVDLGDVTDDAPLRLTFEAHPKVSDGVTITLKTEEQYGKAVALWMNKSGPSAVVCGRVDKHYSFHGTPLVSIVTPLYKPLIDHFKQTAESVLGQHYDHWQWCIHDDGSDDEELAKYLLELAKDDRVKVTQTTKNVGISGACNHALTGADGAFFTVLDHDDLLHPEAFLEVVNVINEKPEVMIIYTDEDKVGDDGEYSSANYKPDFSWWMLMSQNYICHMTVYARHFLGDVGNFRSSMDGAQDYDYILRCAREVENPATDIVHIPRVLYHCRRHESSTSSIKGLSALRDHLECSEHLADGTALAGPYPGTYNIYPPALVKPITVVIPTKDNVTYLDACISSIAESACVDMDVNLVVVNNGSVESETGEYLNGLNSRYVWQFDGKITVLDFDEPFNFSAINNYAVMKVEETRFYVFLNDDVEALSHNWLRELNMFARQPSVGVVGAKLLYPDRRIQHGGVIIGIGGIAGHSHKYIPNGYPGYFARPHIVQDLSAVTGACMMVSGDVFKKVGGFEEKLPKAFNDTDFCLKVREKGYDVVYNPRAVMIHHESVSRGKDNYRDPQFAEAIQYMEDKWHCSTYHDPYYNPNLSLGREDFSYRY